MRSDGGAESAARDAFALLNHEIRLEILLALLEGWEGVYTEPKSYAELMDAVGMRDSGKFNYHLDKLRGVYVREVEGGYVPTASVTALYRAVLAHRPTDRLEYEPTAIDSACPRCGAAPVLRYERGFVSVDCPACEEWIGFTYPFPKNGLERRDGDADAIARAVTRRARRDVGLARDGQCPFCAGTTSVDLRLEALEDGAGGDREDDEIGGDDREGDEIADDGNEYWVGIACETCTFVVGVEPLPALLADGRVAGALAEAGIDRAGYDWELPTPTVRVESRDPARVALVLEGDAGTVTVVIDDTYAVRSVAVDP